MHAVSSSSDERLSMSGPSARQLDSITPCALVNTPATPDLSIVGLSYNDPLVKPLPRPLSSGSCNSQQPLHQVSVPSCSASSSSHRVLKPMNSETAFDISINESVEQNVPITPSPDIQVGPPAPELGSSSSNQQDRVTPVTGSSRSILGRMNSLEAYNYEFGER